jgi:hypothetical protein
MICGGTADVEVRAMRLKQPPEPLRGCCLLALALQP